LVVLFAVAFALFARIREEAFFYITGPVLGAFLGAFAYRRDKSALIADFRGGKSPNTLGLVSPFRHM
jgi:hypothetical protein